MSINKDWVPEYWMYYHTQSLHPTLTVTATDENKNPIPSRKPEGPEALYVRSPLNQSKNLTLTFTYTEPWTSASVSLDKTFTIVPEGKQGDETIVFEVNPISVTLGANSRGDINDFRPSITDIKLKQGARYLAFSASAHTLDRLNTHGTFYIATASIIEKNVKAGNVQFTSSVGIPYTASLIVSASSNMRDLSGSIEYPLIIHPYFTSSIYTASVTINYTKVLEGPPPIQILISPISPSLIADEVGYITPLAFSSSTATTIQVKEGDDFLKLITTESFANADARKGTYTINSIQTSKVGNSWNIVTGLLASSSKSGLTGTINYHTFEHPYVSASALYTIQVYPFALGAGHQPTSSIFTRTQTFTKNITPPRARSVDFKASSYSVNYDRNGRVSANSQEPIVLTATAFNTTASAGRVSFSLFDVALDGSEQFVLQVSGSGTPPTAELTQITYNDIGPDTIKTYKVKITDGNPYISPTIDPYRAEGQLTISGVKAGADSYKLVSTNDNCAIAADLWTTTFSNTGMKITTFNGVQQLINEHPLPLPNDPNDLDFNNEPIGVLGYSSASIVYKDNWITSSISLTGNPASKGNITDWTNPASNTSGVIVYRVDFEGDSSTTDALVRPLARQTQFVTQSIAVQFTPPPPYDVKMENENASAVYRVSGEFELSPTANVIRVYRGATELVNTSTLPATDTDAYGVSGLSKDKCRVSISSVSPAGIVTLAGGLVDGNFVPGTPATFGGITSWVNPNDNPNINIIYQINCEGRQTFFKTQSISIQYEGNVGPGIVMRGEWSEDTDYIGSHQTSNSRRDAVIYSPVPGTTKYYGAISGSGPNTYSNPSIIPGKDGYYVGASPAAGYNRIGKPTINTAPTPNADNVYWQYLGEEEFFVAAKIAIFEESYVKNTINVGTKDGTSGFANIVLAGGRPDPYIAIGQNATVGTAGTSGTTNTNGVIGYDRPGIFLGIYEAGSSGTTGRFSIKTTGTSGKGMFWDGDQLTIVGAIRQITPGTPEGSFRGTWASGVTYYPDDTVTYTTSTYINSFTHTSTNDTNINTGFPPNATNRWTVFAAAGTSGVSGTSGQNGANGSSGTSGAAGTPGPGVSFRGNFATGTLYFHTPSRKDVVRVGSTYYLVNNLALNGQAGTAWGTPTGVNTNWASFGAQFSSVATDVLLAQDANIYNGLVIGTDGLTNGFIRSTGASTLTTGTDPGFYLQQDGKFRFGGNVTAGNPYIYWDNSVLEIRGKIITDDNSVSQIGNWLVENGNFRDTTNSVVLNASQKALQVFNSSGAKKVEIRQANISDPGGSFGSVSINPPAQDFTTAVILNSSSPGLNEYVSTGVAITVAAAGTYTVASRNWGSSNNIEATANGVFSGDFYMYMDAEIWTTNNFTGTQIDSFTIANNNGIIEEFGDTMGLTYAGTGYPYTITFPAAGTYYIFTRLSTSGNIYSGTVTITGITDPDAQSFGVQLDQTEIGGDGMLVIADSSNYVKIQRTTSAPIIDIKTDKAYPALRITNANASGRAIEVLDGDIYLSGAGNNFRVNNGWIGTDNTNNGGVRMGLNTPAGGNPESCLIGSNFPSQNTNVATARLRIASPATKLGITGRELIWDSSSTIRVKTNIEDYPNSAYDTIKKLKAVLYTPLQVVNTFTFETNGEEDYSKTYPMPNALEYIGKQGGFIAEWVDADPELRRYVTYGKDKNGKHTTDTIAYDKIVVPLTKAVQMLMDKVEALEAYISSSKI
jgi:hypothetical protein